MHIEELNYTFPDNLIATKPSDSPRVLLASNSTSSEPKEITKNALLDLFQAGDALVINETKVVKRKVAAFSTHDKGFDVLFVDRVNDTDWQVLLPTKRLAKDKQIQFANGKQAELVESGLPQTIRFKNRIEDDFFEKNGRMPLPPYIEKMRSTSESYDDEAWYQTAWANKAGSAAAPTASLHFTKEDLQVLEARGVVVAKVCLHVGLGTFQPIQAEDIREHHLHYEEVFIDKSELNKILQVKKKQKKVWGLGTTVCRSLESYARNMLKVDGEENIVGETNLYIKPGDDFLLVDNILTNFHQPKTSLLALVAAYSSIENVKKNYQWAIENQFRLFSYGDLSVWTK